MTGPSAAGALLVAAGLASTAGLASAAAAGAAAVTGGPELARGALAFEKCYACHSVKAGEHGLPGPNLRTVFGRRAGSLPEYEYSAAMLDAGRRGGIVWDERSLDAFLADPEAYIPGTLMGFVGIRDPAERRALIEYLRAVGGGAPESGRRAP